MLKHYGVDIYHTITDDRNGRPFRELEKLHIVTRSEKHALTLVELDFFPRYENPQIIRVNFIANVDKIWE